MKDFDEIETVETFSFLCAEQGQKLIMDDIKEKGINRVVAAA